MYWQIGITVLCIRFFYSLRSLRTIPEFYCTVFFYYSGGKEGDPDFCVRAAQPGNEEKKQEKMVMMMRRRRMGSTGFAVTSNVVGSGGGRKSCTVVVASIVTNGVGGGGGVCLCHRRRKEEEEELRRRREEGWLWWRRRRTKAGLRSILARKAGMMVGRRESAGLDFIRSVLLMTRPSSFSSLSSSSPLWTTAAAAAAATMEERRRRGKGEREPGGSCFRVQWNLDSIAILVSRENILKGRFVDVLRYYCSTTVTVRT